MSNPINQKSHLKVVFYIQKKVVDYKNEKPKSVILSTTKAKYIALFLVTKITI